MGLPSAKVFIYHTQMSAFCLCFSCEPLRFHAPQSILPSHGPGFHVNTGWTSKVEEMKCVPYSVVCRAWCKQMSASLHYPICPKESKHHPLIF
mmetsp:Transcript_80477/g.141807  ORF Transcript_80477/g.141807 Transcript_80477/m.141807 type:complete len:93 (+) Transcript_80477:513-791(+)